MAHRLLTALAGGLVATASVAQLSAPPPAPSREDAAPAPVPAGERESDESEQEEAPAAAPAPEQAPPPAALPPAAPAVPPPPPPPPPPPAPPPVDPAIAAFGFWGGLAESNWASQDGRTIFSYRWNPRHDAVIGDVYDGSEAGRRSVVYREPAGEGLRIETSYPDGRVVAGKIAMPDDVTAIQTNADTPASRTIYHRASEINVLVEQQTRQADGSWLTTRIDSRRRVSADERARLIAADRARAAAPPPAPTPAAAPPPQPERRGGLIGRIGSGVGNLLGRKSEPDAPAPPPPADNPPS